MTRWMTQSRQAGAGCLPGGHLQSGKTNINRRRPTSADRIRDKVVDLERKWRKRRESSSVNESEATSASDAFRRWRWWWWWWLRNRPPGIRGILPRKPSLIRGVSRVDPEAIRWWIGKSYNFYRVLNVIKEVVGLKLGGLLLYSHPWYGFVKSIWHTT